MLTDQQLAILQLEHRHYRYAGRKAAAIKDELGLGVTAYYQALNAMLDDPEALLVAPMVIRRLQRIRAQRMAAKRASA